MNCPKCGQDVPGGFAFCPNCGEATRDPSAATVAISVQQMEDPLLVAVREALSPYYTIEKELGRGGMAVVYRGKEKGLEREVAVKVLPPEMALQGGTAERFKREARLAASLEHQNIIPVYRVGEEKGMHYMAMKFVRGRGLDTIIEQQGALPVPVVTRILAAAAAGLAHAHEHSIVHRDIKGANILIENDGRPLVSDFGIARAMTETSLTASGMVVGTPNFMSPEQCGGQKVGPQSDQYSLAILGFQMLTGQLPFEGESIMQVIQHHYMTPPPDIRTVRQGVPEELLAVIYKALNKKPENRFATTQEMAEAFEAVPLTAEEKRRSLAMLKALSHGERVSQVRTDSLPPLSLTASITGGQAAAAEATEKLAAKPAPAPARPVRPAPAPKKKKSRTGLIAAVIVTVLAAGGGVAAWQMGLIGGRPQTATPAGSTGTTGAPAPQVNAPPSAAQPAAQPAVDSAPPSQRPPTRQPGTSTRPRPQQQAAPVQTPQQQAPAPAPSSSAAYPVLISAVDHIEARIVVDGQLRGSGRTTVQLTAGTHRVEITDTGCQPLSTTITVVAGVQNRFPFTLQCQ